MIRGAGISKNDLTLSGASLRRQWSNTDGRMGACFGDFLEIRQFVWEPVPLQVGTNASELPYAGGVSPEIHFR